MPQSKLQVFISYCRDATPDAEIAKAIDESLHSDFDVFFDQKNRPGVPFGPKTDAAIQNADYFLALVSAHPTQPTSHVNGERERAINCWQSSNKPNIIPVLIDLDAKDIPYPLNRMIGLHAVHWDSKKPKPELAALLRRAIEAPWTDETPRTLLIDETVFRVNQTRDDFVVIVEGSHRQYSSGLTEVQNLASALRLRLGQMSERYIESRPEDRNEITREISELAKTGSQLKEAIFGGHQKAKELENSLVPRIGRRRCWFVIQNSSSLVHVPWGLLFDWPEGKERRAKLTREELQRGFWCMKHDVCTILSQESDSHSLDEDIELSLAPKQVVGIFNEAAFEYANDQGLRGWPSEAACLTRDALKARLRDVDNALLYFFCDADAQGSLYFGRCGRAPTDQLTPEMVRQWMTKRALARQKTFLFLNGCMTCARPKVNTWLCPVVHASLLGTIVTEAVVPTRFAWNFGRDLLRRTLIDGKNSLDATSELREKHWPLGLLYSLYSSTKRAMIRGSGMNFPEPVHDNYSYRVFGRNPESTLPFRGN